MPETNKNYFDPKVLAGISNLALRARWVVEGMMSGIHRSRAKGFSVEFEEHREYSPGDEIRRIDWKALGKFDRYFIKEYEDETNLRAYLLVDASGSMNYASDGISKFDYACTLAASTSPSWPTCATTASDGAERAKAAPREGNPSPLWVPPSWTRENSDWDWSEVVRSY